MKVFVTGCCGYLEFDVTNELALRNHVSISFDIHMICGKPSEVSEVNTLFYIHLDITDREAMNKIIEEIRPDVIIHCTVWTNIDAAEAVENHDMVYAVNVEVTEN